MATAAPQIVAPSEYLPHRLALLGKEKEHTRANDALSVQRRALPLVEITKDYTFTTLDANGQETAITLLQLFSHRRQLIIRHHMFDPSWAAGCTSCAMGSDFDVALEHLWSRDTSFVHVSRAPIAKIDAYKKRMGWSFPWVSSYGSDFNYDFHVTLDPDVAPAQYNFYSEEQLKGRGLEYSMKGEQPGMSSFIRGGRGVGVDGQVYHTYSTYARGLEKSDFMGLLDLTYLGRQETDNQPAQKRRSEYTEEELRGSM